MTTRRVNPSPSKIQKQQRDDDDNDSDFGDYINSDGKFKTFNLFVYNLFDF